MKRTTACLAGLLLGNMIIFPCISEPLGNSTDAATVSDVNAPQGPVWEQAKREWALGYAAVLTERNHDSHTLLGGCLLTEAGKADKKRLLSDFWDIHSRKEFFETLKSMEEGGHRSNFEKVRYSHRSPDRKTISGPARTGRQSGGNQQAPRGPTVRQAIGLQGPVRMGLQQSHLPVPLGLCGRVPR